MRFNRLVPVSFLISFILVTAGAYLKITHAEGADTWLTAGMIVSLIFIVAAVYEVRSSRRIDATEKNVWTLALVLFSTIAGIIYVLLARKRIAGDHGKLSS
ncbi:MAG TPA: hypothetical protein VFZ78_00675 [Flavisolibacter sp.]